ncbi:MAG: tetratricopeptide repeat protein [Flavobacteriales bacterium]|nr:tetratricopeptide repeat protein [Flavobacteriales bacterium]
MKALNRLLVATVLIFTAAASSAQKRGQELLDSLLQELHKTERDTTKVKLLYDLSRVYYISGDYERALNYVDESKQLAEELEYRKGVADALMALGLLSQARGDFSLALKHLSASLKMREAEGDKTALVKTYNNIGGVYYSQSDYTEALRNHIAALKIGEEIGDQKGIAYAHGNIGNVYHQQRNYREALSHHFAALKLLEDRGFAEQMGAYINIGRAYNELDEYSEALRYLSHSLEIAVSIGNKRQIAECYADIGGVCWNKGDYAEALKNHLASLRINEEIGDKSGIATCCINIAYAHQSLNDNVEAKRWVVKGLIFAHKIGKNAMLSRAHKAFYAVAGQLNDYKGAYEHYKLHILHRDSVFNEKKSKELVHAQLQYEFEKEEAVDSLAQAVRTVHLENENEIVQLEATKRQNTSRAIAGAGILMLIGGGTAFTLDRKRRKERHARQAALLETHAWRAQVNPRFIHSALNSIHEYVDANDRTLASKFLTRFARLMRAVLENAKQEEVSLRSDLDVLRDYLELEQARLHDRFSYAIEWWIPPWIRTT